MAVKPDQRLAGQSEPTPELSRFPAQAQKVFLVDSLEDARLEAEATFFKLFPVFSVARLAGGAETVPGSNEFAECLVVDRRFNVGGCL